MAEEKQLLARARDYMQALSEGKHPLTGRSLEQDTALDEPRLRRCFAFVAAYLQRELTRATDSTQVYVPTPEEAARLCSDEDVVAADFYDRIAAAASAAGKRAVTAREINDFLLRSALIEGKVESVFVERRVLRATERSEELGIYDKPRLSPRTGAMTHALMLTPEAQAWLLGVLPLIVQPPQEQEETGR